MGLVLLLSFLPSEPPEVVPWLTVAMPANQLCEYIRGDPDSVALAKPAIRCNALSLVARCTSRAHGTIPRQP